MGPNKAIGWLTSATKRASGPMPMLHGLRLRTQGNTWASPSHACLDPTRHPRRSRTPLPPVPGIFYTSTLPQNYPTSDTPRARRGARATTRSIQTGDRHFLASRRKLALWFPTQIAVNIF